MQRLAGQRGHGGTDERQNAKAQRQRRGRYKHQPPRAEAIKQPIAQQQKGNFAG